MDSALVVIVLRLVHIVGGLLWVGAVVYNAAFVMPAVRAVGPAGGQVMQQIAQVRRMPMYMMATAILVVLSGITLMWRNSAGFQNGWMGTGPGRTFSIGAALGILAVVYGAAFVSPAARRFAALAGASRGAGGPPPAEQVAEMQRLQARLGFGTNAVAVVLLLAAAAMAVARYVP